jgi:hypothetical protein
VKKWFKCWTSVDTWALLWMLVLMASMYAAMAVSAAH